MANTGNTQQQINYGASANDGQGDPLRTAFIKTDDNFDNVWLAGPVGSNITIGNNTIQSNNTNGNIVLKPNGTGIVQANASIIPNADNTRDLGSSTQAWRRAYINELLPEDLTVSGDAVINGNLTVQGDTIQIGNITTDTLTIQLANTAANAASANGAGITVGANDNIATFRYTSGANRWNTNIGLNVTGGFSANSSGNVWNINNDFLSFPSGASWRSDKFTLDEYIQSAVDGYLNLQTYDNTSNVATEFHMEHGVVQLNIYNGNNVTWEFDSTGNLTLPGNTFAVNYANGIAVSLGGGYGNANVVANLAAFSNNPISTTGNVNTGRLSVTGNVTANSAGNVWAWQNDTMSFPSGASWRSDRFTLDEYIQSAANGYLNLQTFDNTSNVATELHMEHGVVQFNIYNGTLKTWNFNENGSTTFPGDVLPSANLGGSLGNSSLYWSNLWVANNTIYIGGVPLGMTAGNVLTVNGNNITGTVTFSDEAVIGTGTSNTQSGLYLAPDPVSLANDLYLRVRGNIQDEPTHIHFDTGNNAYYNQFIGDDNKYIQLANTGNIVINASDYAGNTAQWNFDTDGTLTLPAGSSRITSYGQITIETDNNASGMYLNADGVNLLYANTNVTLRANSTGTNKDWNFGNTGVLTLPHGASLNDTSGDSVAFGQDAGVNNQDQHSVAIGPQAGRNNQGEDSVAIGYLAGRDDQADFSIAIGWNAGANTQGQHAQAYGRNAGAYYQQSDAVALGQNAARYLQKQQAIAIGYYAGYGQPEFTTVVNMQASNTVRLNTNTGLFPGMTAVGGSILPTSGITIASLLGGEDVVLSSDPPTPLSPGNSLLFYTPQGTQAVAIGSTAGYRFQGQNAVAVGSRAGQTRQGNASVSIGQDAGFTTQGANSVAIGTSAGNTGQGQTSIAIGSSAGQTTQGQAAVAMGFRAGETTQGSSSIALGEEAGLAGQGQNSIAIGRSAGQTSQGTAAIAMGWAAAQTTQGNAAVAIGEDAGRYYQGEYSVAIGYRAGYNTQGNNSIVLNATGSQINGITANSFTVTPVRNDVANIGNVMFYNTTSKEVTYGNAISVAGNITGGNLTTAGLVSATGTITAGNLTVGSGTITGGNFNGANFNGNVAFGTGTVGGSGNITGGNLITTGAGGNITLTGGNITGANVVTANAVSAIGNITAANFFGNGNTLSNVATQVTGSWTVTTGTNNYSFTVPANNTYQLWVLGNIPNGIIVYNATVSVSNPNVPVIGQQFAWNYEGAGNPILLTSIPAQVIGTAGAISNAQPAVATTNVFTFGINNASGNTVTVNYGYTKIS